MFQDITQGPGHGTYMDHTWEILLMLLTAFLLGWLLGYILWYKWRKMYVELQGEHSRLQARFTDLEKDHASLRYKCDEWEKENHDLRMKVMHLDSDVAALKAKLGRCETDLAAAMDAAVSSQGGGGATGRSAAAAPAIAFSAAPDAISAISVPPAPVAAAPVMAAAPKPDDLKLVEGIGPKIEKLCNQTGIWTWRQLADTQVDVLRKMLDDAGSNFRISDPTTWPRQGELAADGKWDELKVYQDFLQGGKDPD